MNLTTINKSVRSAFHAAGYRGQGTTVALIDSGCNLRDNRVACVPGFDAPDAEGHGSMITALLLEWLPECRILSYNIKGGTAFGSITNALRDILQRAKAGGQYLVNVSQATGYDADHEQLINELVARNVPVFAAAGNDGGEGIGIYPSHYWAPICVAALNNDGSRASFSTFHGEMDFAEVGTGVAVTVNGVTGVYNGTSVACPILLAKAALVVCEQPGITEPQLYSTLKAAAVDLGAVDCDPYTGWGHVAPKPRGKEENVSRIPAFLAYLETKLGNIYVWGAQGQVVSSMANPEVWIKSRETSTKNADRAIAFYKKVKASGKNPIEAYDCSGLIMYYVQNLMGWSKGDSSAEGLYSTCKKLTKAQLEAGDLCFIYSAKEGKMVHVGVYIGDGQTVEAYGRDRGVVKLPLSAGEWTHYGRLAVLQEDTKEDNTVAKVITKNLKYDADVEALQKALNALGYPCGTPDGKAGDNTLNGIAAFCAAHSAPVTVETPAVLPDEIALSVEISGKRYELTLKQA